MSDLTQVTCPSCRGACCHENDETGQHPICKFCDGFGTVSAALDAQWTRDHQRALRTVERVRKMMAAA